MGWEIFGIASDRRKGCSDRCNKNRTRHFFVHFYLFPCLRVRAKITSQNWRSDLVQVWLIRESKTTGIVSYFEDFANEASAKDDLKRRCENVKLFLREP